MTFLDKIRALDAGCTGAPWVGSPAIAGQTLITGFDGYTVCVAEGSAFPKIRDAEAIVLLRNALPEIAALVEAAKSMLAYDDSLPECEEGPDCEGCACAKAIRAALSRLDERAKGNA